MKIAFALVGLQGAGKTVVGEVLSELGVKNVTSFVTSLKGKDEAEALSMLSSPASVYAELQNPDEQTVASLQANGVHVIEIVRGGEKVFFNADTTIDNTGDGLESFQYAVRAGFFRMLRGKAVDAASPAASPEVTEQKTSESPAAPASTAETPAA